MPFSLLSLFWFPPTITSFPPFGGNILCGNFLWRYYILLDIFLVCIYLVFPFIRRPSCISCIFLAEKKLSFMSFEGPANDFLINKNILSISIHIQTYLCNPLSGRSFEQFGLKMEKLTSTFTDGTPVIHEETGFMGAFNSEKCSAFHCAHSAENLCCKFCSQVHEWCNGGNWL